MGHASSKSRGDEVSPTTTTSSSCPASSASAPRTVTVNYSLCILPSPDDHYNVELNQQGSSNSSSSSTSPTSDGYNGTEGQTALETDEARALRPLTMATYNFHLHVDTSADEMQDSNQMQLFPRRWRTSPTHPWKRRPAMSMAMFPMTRSSSLNTSTSTAKSCTAEEGVLWQE